MTRLTEQGRNVAMEALKERRRKNATAKRVDNSSLPAGSPMYYYCLSCGDPIVVPEGWINKPDLCGECEAMQKLGWLTE